MNKRLYETRKSIMERLMSNPNTHPSCKILVEEVYNRYLDSDNLWEYFYTLVEIAELKVGDYKLYRIQRVPFFCVVILFLCYKVMVTTTLNPVFITHIVVIAIIRYFSKIGSRVYNDIVQVFSFDVVDTFIAQINL